MLTKICWQNHDLIYLYYMFTFLTNHIFFQSPRNTPNHRKLVECVMAHKQGVHIDLLHVIAYGPTSSKLPAVNLLFFYWPSLNPTPAERKDIVDRYLSANQRWDFKSLNPSKTQPKRIFTPK